MSSPELGADGASDSPGPPTIALKLEVAVLPGRE
jgi:hypothetical protein